VRVASLVSHASDNGALVPVEPVGKGAPKIRLWLPCSRCIGARSSYPIVDVILESIMGTTDLRKHLQAFEVLLDDALTALPSRQWASSASLRIALKFAR
jgi:hypothetical protein